MLVYGHNVEFVKENRQKSVGRGTSVGHGNNSLAPKEDGNPKVRKLSFLTSNVSMFTFCNSLKQ